VQVYGASLRDHASACLVMELVQGGNLHQRIYDRTRPRLTYLEILQVKTQALTLLEILQI
jgi:serine/threonine protein kinase